MPKEGDVTYEQQCDVILKLEHLWFQALSITPKNQTPIKCIHENLINDSFTTIFLNHFKKASRDFDKFEFWNESLYMMGYYMSLMALFDFKFSKINIMH
jgi:hypothetical protein